MTQLTQLTPRGPRGVNDSAGDVDKEVGLADVAVRGAIYTVTSTANSLPERGNLMTTSIIRLSPFILVL